MALKGVKVLEFVGLAPGPFCGKILADFGATVTRIDKVYDNPIDMQTHGKRTLAINLKAPKGQELVRRLAKDSDVLIEPFRPGVMEKLNLGPELLCKEQPRLIYARLTGFGQTGRLAQRAGHDINYAAMSGVLSMLGEHEKPPKAPINLLADFAGGGLMCALGICIALLERHNSGRGQIIDAAMVDGAAYVASWLFLSRSLPLWIGERGLNILDGGAYYYDTYKTKDDKYMSVGALEPQFFEKFKERLGLSELTQFAFEPTEQATLKRTVEQAFIQKTQAEWARIFEDSDACVYPVLEWDKAMLHDHNVVRKNFEIVDNKIMPRPAPCLSRTPGKISALKNNYEESISTLMELKLRDDELKLLINEGVILIPSQHAKL